MASTQKAQHETPVFLPLKQAGELIATPPETIRYWIHLGRLKAYKPGRQVLVKVSELVERVESSAWDEKRTARAKQARAAAKNAEKDL